MTKEEEIEELRERVAKLEKALSEIYPGWEWGRCIPGCTCAACEY